MPNYNTINCPVCGRELTREILNYAYDKNTNTIRKDMGASEYYCYPCQHYIKLTHYLDESDKFIMITRGMRI